MKSHRARDIGTLVQRETPKFILPDPEMWPRNSSYLNSLDYSVWSIPEDRIIRGSMMRRVERTSAEGVEAAGPLRHRGSDCVLVYSRLSACVRVNGGHFEDKFWTNDFLVCFVRFTDTSLRKSIYKHVQSASIAWIVLLLCPRLSHGTVATKRMCGRTFLHRVLCSLPKLCTKRKFVNIFVTVTAKKSVAPFYVDTVYMYIHREPKKHTKMFFFDI